MFKGSEDLLEFVCICGHIMAKGGSLIWVMQACQYVQIKHLLLKVLVFGTPESLLCPCLQYTVDISCSEHAFVRNALVPISKHFQLIMN